MRKVYLWGKMYLLSLTEVDFETWQSVSEVNIYQLLCFSSEELRVQENKIDLNLQKGSDAKPWN